MDNFVLVLIKTYPRDNNYETRGKIIVYWKQIFLMSQKVSPFVLSFLFILGEREKKGMSETSKEGEHCDY